jgi:hypothetical protein
MTTSTKTVEIKVERTIPAPPSEVFDAWLDPKIPGTPWHENKKLIVDPKVDGLWYWLAMGGFPTMGDLSKSIDQVESSIPGCHGIPWERNQLLRSHSRKRGKALCLLSCIPAFRMMPWQKGTRRAGILFSTNSARFLPVDHTVGSNTRTTFYLTQARMKSPEAE